MNHSPRTYRPTERCRDGTSSAVARPIPLVIPVTSVTLPGNRSIASRVSRIPA